jgi:hypothetical protein
MCSLVRTLVLLILRVLYVWLASSSWRLGVVCLAGLFQMGIVNLLAFGHRVFGWALPDGLCQPPGVRRCLFAAVFCFAIAAL